MIEADFQALPLAACAQAGIEAARALGAEHVDVRISRQRTRSATVHDANPLALVADSATGLGVRVLVDGVWGFASGDAVSTASAAEVARLAVAMARVAAPVARERVELAPEPVHAGRAWANPVAIDPFLVPDSEVLALLEARSAALLASAHVQRVDAGFQAFRDITYYADSAGTDTLQQRTRVAGDVMAFHITDERFDDMSSCAPPVARGWEYLVGDGAWDWDSELSALPELLAEKSVAPSVEPGRYDLVLDPTNLWLTIHESVGHATELDRALGYEANYAGSSFATLDQLGSLRYGSAAHARDR